ncbi:NlpC/P60 family protein [Aeromicrobium camelliae]|uniref:NlpC/P60 family protein n=1 Tax=Aeromicrobium camelliae TaxID=1538144 RepID=UPI00140AFC7F|nr:NlpC/P60 family protein [Aeromicrobium camelliae]
MAGLAIGLPIMQGNAATCAPLELGNVETAGLDGWNDEQLSNAAIIVKVGAEKGISARGQTIAVMTAIGESSLINIDRGDAVGPDSRGLFQQRDNGAWGSYEDRMNPAKAAAMFYDALLRVDGWEELDPTLAAHRVQRNADPYHYEKYWSDALAIVAALSETSIDEAAAITGPNCSPDAANVVWTSGEDCDFGPLDNPRSCEEALAEAARIATAAPCTNEVRGGSWRRRCLEFVARAYGYTYSGVPTARAMHDELAAQGLVSKSDDIPAGALVFFDSSDPAGHVALYAGNGQAFSNDYVRSGCIDLTPMDQMGSGGRYLGWAPPVFTKGG